MRPRHRTQLLVAAGALALAALGCVGSGKTPLAPAESSAAAPAAAPAAPAVAPAPPPLTPIPEAEVPRAAIAALTRLRALRSLANRTHEVDSIAAEVGPVLDSVAGLKEWLGSRDPNQQTARALRSLGQEWR